MFGRVSGKDCAFLSTKSKGFNLFLMKDFFYCCQKIYVKYLYVILTHKYQTDFFKNARKHFVEFVK